MHLLALHVYATIVNEKKNFEGRLKRKVLQKFEHLLDEEIISIVISIRHINRGLFAILTFASENLFAWFFFETDFFIQEYCRLQDKKDFSNRLSKLFDLFDVSDDLEILE